MEDKIKRLEWLDEEIFFTNNSCFLKFKEIVPEFITTDIYNPKIRKKNVSLVCDAPHGPLTFDSTYSYGFDIMRQFPGDSRLTEYIYANIEITKLDLFFSSNDSCKAIRERFKKTKLILEDIVREKLLTNKQAVNIVNIGSGPGRDTMDVMYKLLNENPSYQINTTLVDNDPYALEKGKKYAHQLGLTTNVHFSKNTIKQYKNDGYDIAVLVGVLCPFREDTCINIVTQVGKTLKEGGVLIASNISKKVTEIEEGQLTRFINEYICNWFLTFKNHEELRSVFNKGGYTNITIEQEQVGYHLLGVGTK